MIPCKSTLTAFLDEDLISKFQLFDRSRMIGPKWSCAQCWTNLSIPRQFRYHHTKFQFTLDKEDRTVISLSQLDDRYIRGLEGPYEFSLEFRLEKDGEGEILARSSSSYNTRRSVNSELDLEAGTYSLFLKIKADRTLPRQQVKEASKNYLKEDPTKFIQIAKKYNLAFMKAGLGDEERETRSLDLQTPVEPAKEESKKPQASPQSVDVEAPLSPVAHSMEDVKDVKEQVVVSTDEPVENPITMPPAQIVTQSESKTDGTGDDSAKVKNPNDDWDAIVTIGLRLLTRNATVKLSVVSSNPPKEPAVLISRQSFPVGNIPPLPGDAVESSNASGSTTSSKPEVLTPESEKDKPKAEEVAKEETTKETKEQDLSATEANEATSQGTEVKPEATASYQAESNEVSGVKSLPPSIDAVISEPPAELQSAEQDKPKATDAPKRFHVRF